jgi:hypothetical protein
MINPNYFAVIFIYFLSPLANSGGLELHKSIGISTLCRLTFGIVGYLPTNSPWHKKTQWSTGFL